jgi:hypothetical protein
VPAFVRYDLRVSRTHVDALCVEKDGFYDVPGRRDPFYLEVGYHYVFVDGILIGYESKGFLSQYVTTADTAPPILTRYHRIAAVLLDLSFLVGTSLCHPGVLDASGWTRSQPEGGLVDTSTRLKNARQAAKEAMDTALGTKHNLGGLVRVIRLRLSGKKARERVLRETLARLDSVAPGPPDPEGSGNPTK